ncbi:MAG: cob(I)yrinic acid a,c-diamide adenosyltransferase [Ilumatobacteraceae bacterium]
MTADDTTQPLIDDPRPDGLRHADSLVLLNTGNGKGKSSAAFGVMVRGVARDWRVAVVQFIKGSDWKVGEEKVGRQLGVDWHALGGGFTWDSEDQSADIALARTAWQQAAAIVTAGEHDLVILDEITYLCTWGWVPVEEVVGVIAGRPRHVNVVMTGRDAPQELIDLADTVTEMREIKHAYTAGFTAKRGIDY